MLNSIVVKTKLLLDEEVVEAGSFAEAARQTGTVKSVITKRVNQLEEHLELQLMQRSTRRLTITDGGSEFYQRAVHVLAELDQAKATVSSTEWGLTGNLELAVFLPLQQHTWLMIFANFKRNTRN